MNTQAILDRAKAMYDKARVASAGMLPEWDALGQAARDVWLGHAQEIEAEIIAAAPSFVRQNWPFLVVAASLLLNILQATGVVTQEQANIIKGVVRDVRTEPTVAPASQPAPVIIIVQPTRVPRHPTTRPDGP